MIYVGIDIAKLNHFAAVISSDGEILIEPFKFTNDYDGFYLLLSKLAPLDQNSIIIGLESTAHYGDNLVRFLISKDFKVCVLNPIQTSSMRKNNVRKTKTDKVDTFVIAKTLMMQDSLLKHHTDCRIVFYVRFHFFCYHFGSLLCLCLKCYRFVFLFPKMIQPTNASTSRLTIIHTASTASPFGLNIS